MRWNSELLLIEIFSFVFMIAGLFWDLCYAKVCKKDGIYKMLFQFIPATAVWMVMFLLAIYNSEMYVLTCFFMRLLLFDGYLS